MTLIPIHLNVPAADNFGGLGLRALVQNHTGVCPIPSILPVFVDPGHFDASYIMARSHCGTHRLTTFGEGYLSSGRYSYTLPARSSNT
jgi:hypothetical protein